MAYYNIVGRYMNGTSVVKYELLEQDGTSKMTVSKHELIELTNNGYVLNCKTIKNGEDTYGISGIGCKISELPVINLNKRVDITKNSDDEYGKCIEATARLIYGDNGGIVRSYGIGMHATGLTVGYILKNISKKRIKLEDFCVEIDESIVLTRDETSQLLQHKSINYVISNAKLVRGSSKVVSYYLAFNHTDRLNRDIQIGNKDEQWLWTVKDEFKAKFGYLEPTLIGQKLKVEAKLVSDISFSAAYNKDLKPHNNGETVGYIISNIGYCDINVNSIVIKAQEKKALTLEENEKLVLSSEVNGKISNAKIIKGSIGHYFYKLYNPDKECETVNITESNTDKSLHLAQRVRKEYIDKFGYLEKTKNSTASKTGNHEGYATGIISRFIK